MKKCILLSCIILIAFAVSNCKKNIPSEPAPYKSPTTTRTSTEVQSPTITCTYTISETVTDTVTPTVTSTSTITPTITPLETTGVTISGADFPFSSAGEISSWNSAGYPITGVYFESAQYYDAPGSMRLSWDGTYGPASSVMHSMSSTDLANHTLSFYIKCPPEMAGYQINLNLGTVTGGVGRYMGDADGSGEWQHFTWDMAANPPCCIADPAQTTGVGIAINRGSQPQVNSANIYIDSVDFSY
jgi:hypothetical protein